MAEVHGAATTAKDIVATALGHRAMQAAASWKDMAWQCVVMTQICARHYDLLPSATERLTWGPHRPELQETSFGKG